MIAAAVKRLAAAEIVEQVRTLGLRKDVSPAEALIEEVQWTAGHVEWLRQQVQQLETDELTWGITQTVDQQSGKGRKGVDTTSAAGTHALVKLYQAEREHLVRCSAAAIRCGVEVARVELAKRMGTEFVSQFRQVIADEELALTPEQRVAATAAMQRVLRGLGS